MASQAAELKMPQAGGAPREPSMEEILASIRRIIEDSDQGRKAEEVLPARDAEPEPMEMIAANAPTSTFEFAGPSRPAAEEPVAATRQPEAVATVRSQSPEFLRTGTARAAHRAEPEAPVAGPVVAGKTPPAPAAADMAPAAVAGEPAAEATVEQIAAKPLAVAAEKASLISERTGRQVAAAFGELSEAFEASRRKSFDELAAEMMRPMLQDWLDNNLPTLVEKLVREEIERVARGGR